MNEKRKDCLPFKSTQEPNVTGNSVINQLKIIAIQFRGIG